MSARSRGSRFCTTKEFVLPLLAKTLKGPEREGKGVCVGGGGGGRGVIAWWERAVSGKGLSQNQDSC